MTSRRTLVLGAAAGALATLDAATNALRAATPAASRMPAIFVGHGSPMNAIQDNAFTRRLREWGAALGRPTAILSVSAHWLTDGDTRVGIQAQPKTIHDFGGFPEALHAMHYPARGAPETAREALKALAAFEAKGDTGWGLDHGTWTVLHHMFPRADIPVFQLSIDYPKPGAHHPAVGRALAGLRDKGVLVMGSGNIVHNLRATQRGVPESPVAGAPWAASFDEKVRQALEARDDMGLVNYRRLDAGAAMAVPTPDHYWPLLYTVGAARPEEKPKTIYTSFQSGTLGMRCVQFG
jgi:4,5-DOPA dioxygenase extradiol